MGNPHHRQFYHSVLVLTALGVEIKNLYEWQPEEAMDKYLRGLGLIAGCAYVSHLFCDAITPRSLPLIGKLQEF
ncbi:metal-dependent hydrolase [Shewanella baltica]|uniref:metal-dependent hydrolase n=1 Tax=Shewanella baltica TaxID=62322 RepID=UPI00217E8167|nr:metal-dependent hydrolase [Shewanella baltica]